GLLREGSPVPRGEEEGRGVLPPRVDRSHLWRSGTDSMNTWTRALFLRDWQTARSLETSPGVKEK
ncbi:MAG: hypothetical protein QW356_09230, partial [Candidatus Hadarchaeales archaeon]